MPEQAASNLPLYSLLVVLAVAAVWDFYHRVLPNVLTYSLLVLGLVWVLYQGSVVDAAFSLAVCLACLLPLYLGGKLGGGDVKLLVALSLFLPWSEFATVLLVCALLAPAWTALRPARWAGVGGNNRAIVLNTRAVPLAVPLFVSTCVIAVSTPGLLS